METWFLVVVLVFNGNPYREVPAYVVAMPNAQECQKLAATYPKGGTVFEKASCAPSMSRQAASVRASSYKE